MVDGVDVHAPSRRFVAHGYFPGLLSVRIGRRHDLWGEANVEVKAGETTRVRVDLEEPDALMD